MADFIVDSSVVMEYLLEDRLTLHARAFFKQITLRDDLLAPEFYLAECTNVVWKQARFYGLDRPRATQLIADLLKIPLRRISIQDLLTPALEIGLKQQLAVYDSIYIALCLETGFPLLTIDQKPARAAQAEGVILKPITDFTPES